MCYTNHHKERHKKQLIQPVHLVAILDPNIRYTLFQYYNLINHPVHYSTLFAARAFFFCNHRQTLQITEKKKRMLKNSNPKVSKIPTDQKQIETQEEK